MKNMQQNIFTPLVGITTARFNREVNPRSGVSQTYVRALQAAGAAPVLIPVGLPAETLLALAQRLDGILFSGGGDVDPIRYGGERSESVDGIDPERDETEIWLVQYAAAHNLPFFGICRGIQVINVALGGTLYTDITLQHPGALRHDYFPDIPRNHLAHRVRVEADSRLARVLGTTEPTVNSLHHQAVRAAAQGLRVLAHAPDDIIEAVELPAHRFGLAVQWHPEDLQGEHPPMRALFTAFVHACRRED